MSLRRPTRREGASGARVAAGIAAAALLLGAARPAEEWDLARLTFSSGWSALPAVVGVERGFFAREGLVVSGLNVSSGKAVITSLGEGSTDFAAVPQRTLLLMAAAEIPAKVVSVAGWRTRMELLVREDRKGLASLADLEGGTIAIIGGSEALPVLVRLLNQADLAVSDVTIRRVEARELARALRKEGGVDAAFASAHFTEALLRAGGLRRLLEAKQVVKTLGYVGASPLLASPLVVEKRPERVARFVRAWIRALRYIQQEPEDAADLLRVYFARQGVEVPEARARGWVRMVRHDRYLWSESAVKDAEYNGWALEEAGLLEVQPELEGYVENRFAREALEALEREDAER